MCLLVVDISCKLGLWFHVFVFFIMCLDSLSEKPCIKSIMVGLDILCKKSNMSFI